MTELKKQKHFRLSTFLAADMRQYLLLCFSCVFLLLICSSQAFAERIKVGVYSNKPLVYEDVEGEINGLFIDVLRYVAQQEGWDLEFVPGSWPECLLRLEQGEIDVQVAIAVSAAREKIFSFSEKTVITNWGRLYRHPDAQFESLLGLDGKSVALLDKDIHAEVFVDLMEKFSQDVKPVFLTSYEEVLKHVQAGEVDAGVVNRLYALQNEHRFQVKTTPMIFNPIEVRYATLKGKNTHLLQAIDRHLEHLKSNKGSLYYQSLEKWFSQSPTTTSLPEWIKPTLLFSGGLLLFFFGMLLLLKKQVVSRNDELKALNLQLTDQVTQLQLAEKDLLESKARLLASEKVARLGHWEHDLRENVLYWSEEIYRIFEKDPDQFSATYAAFLETVHPDDRELVNRSYLESVKKRTPYSIDHRIVLTDGRVKYVHEQCENYSDEGGETVRSLGSVQDITERKQAEESLIRQQRIITLNNRIANVFLTSPQEEIYADVLSVILEALDSPFGYFGYIDDAGDLVCPFISSGVCSHHKVDDKSVVFPSATWGGIWGRSLLEKRSLMANEGLRLPEGHAALQSALAVAIIHQGTLIGQFVVAKKQGIYHPDDQELLESAATQTAPILNALLNEVRQQKKHEKLEAQFRQAQKMEAIGTLAGGIAHDFNNMLGVIIGNAELAQSQVDSTQPIYTDLMEIKKAANRSADLTRQLLAFARKQTVAPKILNLNEIVEGMLKMLQRLIGEDIVLDWMPRMELWSVKIDPGQIDQLMANLCVNARDAITGMGKLTIETKNSSLDEKFCLEFPGFVPGEYVQLVVSDNGCGMDQETRDKIFEPFFTTKRVGEGTGLGLATVYGIVKQNNGFIYVDSKPNHGTTFNIYLPRQSDRAAGKQEIKQAIVNGGHETVLLVEDEAALLEMVGKMLEHSGYRVLHAGTPNEAVNLAKRHTGQIHLLLTDVVMPEMNGQELTKHLLALYPDLRYLFMSGYTADVVAYHGILDEGIHFIQKPFSMEDLAATVRQVLDERKGSGQALVKG